MSRGRSISRLAPLLLAAAVSVWLSACNEKSLPAPTTEAAQASASRDGASLVATADRNELRTVDRLTLTIQATAPEGQVVRSLNIDPESAGWTVVSRSVPMTALDSTGRSVRTDTLVLEPFLEGDYTVPTIAASFASPGAPGSLDLTTSPIAIKVTSVLAADASLTDLAAPAGPIDPPAAKTEPTSPWLIAGVIGAVVGVVLVLVRTVRSRRCEPAEDPERELRLLKAHPAKDPAADRDRLASILWRASLAHPSPALSDLLQRVNTDRYAPPQRRAAAPVEHDIDAALDVLNGGTGSLIPPGPLAYAGEAL